MAKKQDGIAVNQSLLNTIAPAGVKVLNSNTVAVGESIVRYLIVVKYPSKVDYEWLTDVCNQNNSIVSIHCEKELNTGDITTDLSRNISMQRQIILDNKVPADVIVAQNNERSYTTMLDEITNNAESMINMTMVVGVYGENENDLKIKYQNVRNKFMGRGFTVQPLQFEQLNGFKSSVPFDSLHGTVRQQGEQLVPISTLMGGFPFAFAGIIDENGLYVGKDNSGTLIMLDIWKRGGDRINSNAVILGQSGGGKSTSMKMLIVNEYITGTKIIIIDPQREYRDMCREFGGNWVDVCGGSGGRINPLHIYPYIDDDDELDDNTFSMPDLAKHVNKLEVFFKLYLDLTPMQLAILEDCIIQAYANKGIVWDTNLQLIDEGTFPVMSDLYDVVDDKAKELDHKKLATGSNEPNHFKELAYMIKSIGYGADSFLWNGQSTIKTDKDFIVFDTKGIADYNPNKQKALYNNVLSYATNLMYKNRHERVIVVADEAHYIIDSRVPESLSQLNKMAKTARKYEGGLWLATQQTVDFLDPSIKREGSALLDQACIKLLMPIGRGHDLKEVKDLYQLTDAEEEVLTSQQRGRGLLSVGSRRIVANFVIPPHYLEIFGSAGGR